MLACLLVLVRGVQQIQNRLNGHIVTDACVEHGMEELAVRAIRGRW